MNDALLSLLLDPALALVFGLCALVLVGLAAAGHGLSNRGHMPPARPPAPAPALTATEYERIVREARRAARLDHVCGVYSDRASPYPRHSPAAALWSCTYLAERHELEEREREEQRRRAAEPA